MSMLTSEEWERRARNVARRNAENKEVLEEQGIENNLFWNTDVLWSDCLSHMLTYYDITEEEAKEEIANFVKLVNKDIEEFLRCFDEKHGTNYAPTGKQRI